MKKTVETPSDKRLYTQKLKWFRDQGFEEVEPLEFIEIYFLKVHLKRKVYLVVNLMVFLYKLKNEENIRLLLMI